MFSFLLHIVLFLFLRFCHIYFYLTLPLSATTFILQLSFLLCRSNRSNITFLHRFSLSYHFLEFVHLLESLRIWSGLSCVDPLPFRWRPKCFNRNRNLNLFIFLFFLTIPFLFPWSLDRVFSFAFPCNSFAYHLFIQGGMKLLVNRGKATLW